MRRISWAMVFFAMVLLLAWLPACGSSDGSGGGTIQGYTQAMLTGTWAFKRTMKGAPGVERGEIVFDSEGHIIKYVQTSPTISAAKPEKIGGSLHVYPDGRVEGRITYEEVVFLFVFYSKYDYKLRFNADGTISGRRITYLVITIGAWDSPWMSVIGRETHRHKYWLTKR